MILFKEAHDREKIRQIKEHPYYGEDIKRINEIYEQVKDEPIEVLTKSEYFIFNNSVYICLKWNRVCGTVFSDTYCTGCCGKS